MTRRIVAALLVVVIAGACATSEPDPPGQSEPSGSLATTTCADVVVLGVRGNGQAADLNRGVGKEVMRTVTDLAGRLQDRSGASLRLEAVPYDATGTATTDEYFSHVSTGARRAEQQAEALLTRCPGSRIGVVGFSQGAQVVHRFAEDVRPELAGRIAVVGLIADPRRNPADDIRHVSYAQTPVARPGLLGAGERLDPDVRRVAVSFCVEGDEVCNGRGIRGEKTSPAHRRFYETPATARVTAEQLDDVLLANGV